MNLHLLPAENRLFIPKFVEIVKGSHYAQTNLLMCYVSEMVISDITLPFATPDLVIGCIQNKYVNRIIIHALQPQVYSLIKIIKEKAPDCRIDLVYWGESYNDSSRLMGTETLIEFIKERGFSDWLSTFMVKTRFAHALLHLRSARVTGKVSQCLRYIDTFYHWSQIDYEYIKALFKHNQLKYRKFFYDVFDFQLVNNDLIERELECDASNCIVLGHSASMRNNHMDILPAISEYAVKHNKIVICPLSYSNTGKKYIDWIAKRMGEISGLSYRIIYKFYSAKDYLSFLSRCGAYIAPGRGSIGAGNMISYTMSGRIPIADFGNSTGAFLKSLGAEVAIYENTSDISNLVDKVFGTHCEKNRINVGDYFSLSEKSRCYKDLLAVV